MKASSALTVDCGPAVNHVSPRSSSPWIVARAADLLLVIATPLFREIDSNEACDYSSPQGESKCVESEAGCGAPCCSV